MSAVLEPTSRVEGMGAILFDKGVAFRVWETRLFTILNSIGTRTIFRLRIITSL